MLSTFVYRQSKFKDTKGSSSPPKEAKYGFGKAGLPQKHSREVQMQSTEPDEPNKFESFIPTSTYIAGDGNSVDDTDIPERMKVMFQSFC